MAEPRSRRKFPDITERFKPVCIYREDIEELYKILSSYKIPLRIDLDEYEINEISGLDDILERRFSHINFSSTSYGFSIDIGKYNYLQINARSPDNYKSSYVDVIQFLSNKKRIFPFLHSEWLYYLLNMAGVGIMLPNIYNFWAEKDNDNRLTVIGLSMISISWLSFLVKGIFVPQFYDKNYLTNRKRAEQKSITFADVIVNLFFAIASGVIVGLLLYLFLPKH